MKKLIALVAALVMLLTVMPVVAETTEDTIPELIGPTYTEEVEKTILIPDPDSKSSISGGDMIEVVVTEEELIDTFFFVKDEAAQAEWYEDEVAKIVDYVSAGNPVMSYLPDETVTDAMCHFPEGTDKDSLVCYEIEAPGVHNYKPEMGDVLVTAVLPTQYPIDAHVVCLVGIHEGTCEDGTNLIKWYVLNTTVNEDGTLAVLFTQEVTERLQDEGHGIILTISDPITAAE